MATSKVALFGFRQAPPRGVYLATAAASVLALCSAWAVLVQLQIFPQSFVPSPVRVLRTGYEMFSEGGFLKDVGASVARVWTAFLVSAVLAIPIGLLMSSFKSVEAIVEPVVDFVRYVPVPSLGPIFILWTGIGEPSKFLVLFFGTFFQLVLIIMDDADNVSQLYFDSARMLGASTKELFRDILVPAMLPQMYDRLRVTLGWCWTYLVIAELLAVDRGVGRTLKEAQRFNAADQMFVCFIILGLIGLCTDYAAKLCYGRLFPYASKTSLRVV